MTIINAVTGAGADPQLVSIDNAVTEFPQTFSPPEGADGLSSVTVQAPANFKASNIKKDVEIAGVTGTYEPEFKKQSKTAQATAFPTVIEPDTGYDGLASATVTAPDNLTSENIKKGVTIAEVEGTYDPEPNLQEKSTKATAFPVVVEPDADYEGLSKATVTAPDNLEPTNIKKNVTIAGITGTYEETFTTQSKDEVPTAFPVTYTPDTGYDGLASVTVEIPTNLQPKNIKKDVTIAGVTGTYEPKTSIISLQATSFPTVVSVEGKELDGYSEVTVRAPNNLEASNIKKDVEIAGVTGTYDAQPNLEEKTTKATAFPTVVDVDRGYDGMTKVTVTAPDNLTAENIKKDVEIAGVTGTYLPDIKEQYTINYDYTGFPITIKASNLGYDGIARIDVNAPPLQKITMTPSSYPTIVKKTSVNYYGLEYVSILKPTNLEAGNIKNGVKIAGITGTYKPYTATAQTTATSFPTVVSVEGTEYDGYTEVKVYAPDNLEAENIKKGVEIAGITGTYEATLQSKDITPTAFPTTITSDDGYDGLASVIVENPTNLEAGNIKKDVEIAGVTGTYEPSLETVIIEPTVFPTTYTPSTGYDGLASITLTKPTNLEASNIKKDVTIAGVTGTYNGEGGSDNTMGLYLTNKPFAITEDAWDGVTGTVTRALSSTNVTSVVIGEGITALAGYMFSACKSLTTVQLPSTLTALPDGCFQNSTVTSVNIPNGITSISASCFYNCASLTEIDIPDTVTMLYSYAFNNCTGLKTITVRTQTPPTVQSLALTGLSSLTTIYVPSGRLNVYKAASGWANHSAKIVEGDF